MATTGRTTTQSALVTALTFTEICVKPERDAQLQDNGLAISFSTMSSNSESRCIALSSGKMLFNLAACRRHQCHARLRWRETAQFQTSFEMLPPALTTRGVWSLMHETKGCKSSELRETLTFLNGCTSDSHRLRIAVYLGLSGQRAQDDHLRHH